MDRDESYSKPSPGDPLSISAALWGDVIDTVAWAKGQRERHGSLDPRRLRSYYVDIKNSSGSDLAACDVLGIGGVFPLPANNLPVFKAGRVILNGTSPAAAYKHRLAVLLQPIKAGEIGRAVVAGIVPVQIAVADTTATAWTQADYTNGDATKLTAKPYGSATILWIDSGTGTKWALVSLGAPGGCTSLWVKLSGALASGSTATATGTYRGVSISLTVRDKLIPSGGDSVASGSLVRARWNHDDDAWDAVNAACV